MRESPCCRERPPRCRRQQRRRRTRVGAAVAHAAAASAERERARRWPGSRAVLAHRSRARSSSRWCLRERERRGLLLEAGRAALAAPRPRSLLSSAARPRPANRPCSEARARSASSAVAFVVAFLDAAQRVATAAARSFRAASITYSVALALIARCPAARQRRAVFDRDAQHHAEARTVRARERARALPVRSKAPRAAPIGAAASKPSCAQTLGERAREHAGCTRRRSRARSRRRDAPAARRGWPSASRPRSREHRQPSTSAIVSARRAALRR